MKKKKKIEECLLLQSTFEDFVWVNDFLETTEKMDDEDFLNVSSVKTADKEEK